MPSWHAACWERAGRSSSDCVTTHGNQRRVVQQAMSQPALTYEHFVAAMEAAGSGMLLLDAHGTILKINQHIEQTFGFSRIELEGQTVERLLPVELRGMHERLRGNYLKAPDARPMGRGRELMGMRKDGSRVLVEIGLNPLRTLDTLFVLCSVLDVAERDRAARSRHLESINRELEEQVRIRTAHLSATLEECEALLHEVHHRVRNNLQILYSLVNMQRRAFADNPALVQLEQCQARIGALALVYDCLNEARDRVRVPFNLYARNLTNNIVSMLDASVTADLELEYASDEVWLGLDQAVPCGLLLNELVMNSLKHAFPSQLGRRIRIGLSKLSDKQMVLTVADNGVGLAPSLDLDEPSSLGFQLIKTLAQQLSARVSVQRNAGTQFDFFFQPA
jgi:PAS domain S-box-containing protein